MAMTMHIIYSDTFRSVGLVAGGLYGPNNDPYDLENYMVAVNTAKDLEAQERIMPLDGLKKS